MSSSRNKYYHPNPRNQNRYWQPKKCIIPIVGQVAIAGLLAQKKFIPESAGTLKTDTLTFGVMTFAVITCSF